MYTTRYQVRVVVIAGCASAKHGRASCSLVTPKGNDFFFFKFVMAGKTCLSDLSKPAAVVSLYSYHVLRIFRTHIPGCTAPRIFALLAGGML